MDVFGTVQGAAARKYRGFTYRQMVPARFGQEVVTAAENQVSCEPSVNCVDLADYRVTIGRAASSGLSPVQLWMEPNHNTEAGEPLLVLTLWVSEGREGCELRQELCDEAVRLAFA